MQKKGVYITSNEIGSLIKKRRSELGISQEELAAALGVTYQQVQRYEGGQNKLNVENIQQVAGALSVPVSYFFGTRAPLVVAERAERADPLPSAASPATADQAPPAQAQALLPP